MTDAELLEIIENDDAWDTGALGRNEEFVRPVKLTPAQEQTIDDAVGLQMISIRLPKSLIEDFKFLGASNGIKYQTLMRQILARYADSEKKSMANKAASAQIKATRQAAKASQDQSNQDRSQFSKYG